MLRKTLTILSIVGLVLSVVLWGLSYLHVAYAPATRIHKFKLSRGKIWFVQLRNAVGDVNDVAQEYLRDHPDVTPCSEVRIHSEFAGTVTFDGSFFVAGFALNDRGFTSSDVDMYDAKFAPRCKSTARGLLVGTPLYLPTLAFALGTFWGTWPTYRRRRRKKLGLCVGCGYDLRGSSERCPECGVVFEASA